MNSQHPLAEGPHPSRVHALLMPWNRFWSGAWSRRLNMGGHWFPIEVLIIGVIFSSPIDLGFIEKHAMVSFLDHNKLVFPNYEYHEYVQVNAT